MCTIPEDPRGYEYTCAACGKVEHFWPPDDCKPGAIPSLMMDAELNACDHGWRPAIGHPRTVEALSKPKPWYCSRACMEKLDQESLIAWDSLHLERRHDGAERVGGWDPVAFTCAGCCRQRLMFGGEKAAAAAGWRPAFRTTDSLSEDAWFHDLDCMQRWDPDGYAKWVKIEAQIAAGGIQ